MSNADEFKRKILERLYADAEKGVGRFRFRFRFRLYFFFLEWVNASRFITASTHCGLATLRSHGIHTGVYQTRLHSACIRSPPGALSKTFLLRLRRNRRTCRVRDEELLHWAISSCPLTRDRDTSCPLSIYIPVRRSQQLA